MTAPLPSERIFAAYEMWVAAGRPTDPESINRLSSEARKASK